MYLCVAVEVGVESEENLLSLSLALCSLGLEPRPSREVADTFTVSHPTAPHS